MSGYGAPAQCKMLQLALKANRDDAATAEERRRESVRLRSAQTTGDAENSTELERSAQLQQRRVNEQVSSYGAPTQRKMLQLALKANRDDAGP